jgi:hypothetical protein
MRNSTRIPTKQNHCAPNCRIPSRPAKHSKGLTAEQQATSAREEGRTRMVPKPEVEERVPRRMK